MITAPRGGFAALDACVHCGFCLQACPTYLATGDEADSPRGRIELMRALERGELAATDSALAFHLDRCLGCRACEPVCPSGVGYGAGLESARERLATQRGVPLVARLALAALTTPGLSGLIFSIARAFRATGLPSLLAGWGRVRFAMGMLAATQDRGGRAVADRSGRSAPSLPAPAASVPPQPAQLFRGCVMNGLFSHVHAATIRTLTVNGYVVREVPGQVCCGALHAHAGLPAAAQALARVNQIAFGDGDTPIIVNSAGCGAMLKQYQPRFAARVRDVTELLAARGPAPGAPLPLRVVYDAPCHLLHAQGVAEPPLAVLRAVPGIELRETADSAQCCGSAGLYTLLEPELSRAVLAPKLALLLDAPPDVLATGNPGCVMQLGAGLRAAGAAVAARHPVELLDASYRAAGFYR
jgi:glycolate oxidase iron-sulfur subunit